MPVSLYRDVQVPKPITKQLRKKGVDVLTAQEDGFERASDLKILERATELGRVVFSEDADFVNEATKKQRYSLEFAGVIYCPMNHLPHRVCIENLWVIAETCEPEHFFNRIEYLPL